MYSSSEQPRWQKLNYAYCSLPFALLITPFERVIRSDGTHIVTSETLSTKEELRRIAKTITSRLIVLSSLWALWSFFYTWVTSYTYIHEKDHGTLTELAVVLGLPT